MNKNQIITLISDWGTADFFAGSMKGKLLSANPNLLLVDITHDIPKHDFFKASFIMRACYKDYPEGSTHIVAVNNQDAVKGQCLIIEYESHFFIGPDNGLFSLVFDNKPSHVYSYKSKLQKNFLSTRDVYAEAAVYLNSEKFPQGLEDISENWTEKVPYRPIPEENQIRGNIIYIDSYQNLITNIPKTMFDEVRQGRRFRICMKREQYDIETVSNTYNDVVHGDRLALFNNLGLLEIAINQGPAAGLLGMKLKDVIRVEFGDGSELF